MSVLREINNVAWSPKLRKHVCSENKFSLDYEEWLWERYLMVASYVCNTETLAKKRGFVVTPADEDDRIPIPDYVKPGILKNNAGKMMRMRFFDGKWAKRLCGRIFSISLQSLLYIGV